ncbi:MAG: nucleotidyltransferase family protein [Candidatus Brockarchaeota archaeon]|nr:nucleotidyltransferase family protein [Candidatus Brockarchaeota archaeon]
MIAVILAGGYATRLYPVTRDVSKPLLPVRGKPMIEYIVEKLEKIGCVDQIVVATNKRFEGQFLEWLAKNPRKNVKVRAERSRSEEEKLGALRALAELTGEVEGDEYLVIAGDNLFTSGLEGFVKFYEERKSPVVAVYDVEDASAVKKYSSAEITSGGEIVGFEEKPERPKTTLIGTCIYLLPRRSILRLREYLGEGSDADSPGHFIEWLCKREKVYAYVLKGEWWDIGTPESYESANRAESLGQPAF